jgi:hypothetical protein
MPTLDVYETESQGHLSRIRGNLALRACCRWFVEEHLARKVM